MRPMKKLIYIFTALVAVVAIASCKKENPYQPRVKTLSVVSSDLTFSNAGGTGTVVVEAEGSVSATSEKTWAQVSVSGKTITVTCDPWDQFETRNTKITITSGDESLAVTAIQQGVVFYMDGAAITDEFVMSSTSEEYVYSFTSNTEVSAESNSEWLTVTYDEETKTISITPEENTEMKTRHGSFTLSAGAEGKTYHVVQYPPFKQTEDWSMALEERGETETKLKATVKASHGYYYPDYTTSAVINRYASVPAFIEEAMVPSMRAELDEAVASYGGRYGYTAFMSNKTTTWTFDLIPDGDYVGIMVGFDADGYPTGWFSANEVFIGELTPYKKWLGTWAVPHGDGTYETWTIEMKEEDKTYWVSGVNNVLPGAFVENDFRAELKFDAETEELVIAVWENLDVTWTDSSRGTCNTLLSGQYTNVQGKTYYNSGVGNVIARVALSSDGGTGTFTPCSVVSGGAPAFFYNIRWYGRYTSSSGSRSGFSWTGVETPISEGMKMTKQ